MAIPAFTAEGWLPEGTHDCTLDEAATRFGAFQRTDRRPQLWAKFLAFVREARACAWIEALVVDGSFVTAVPTPNDIDFIVVVSAQHGFAHDFSPSEYNVLSRRRVQQRFGFDLLVARADSEEYQHYVAFFQQVRGAPQRTKGLLRMHL